MKDFDPATSFGPSVARRYDDQQRGDEDETVDFLAELAAGGPALELAIGTGRIALPLSERGIRVDGIELSADMVARMRDKPGGDAITVTMGDMSREETGASYSLVYLVYNTIYNLLTQDDQVRCFENAARHLTLDGVFVVEAGVPSTNWIRGNQYIDVESITAGAVVLDVNRYDPVTQILDENHVTLSSAGVEMGPISCRLISPPEMDLMARIAGLKLLDRWSGWHRESFTATSHRHVSVYGRSSPDV